MDSVLRWQRGTLVLWNDDRGFGFVRPEQGGKDFFVHISAFRRGLSRRPEIGDVVHYQLAQEIPDKRRIAYAVLQGVAVQPPPGAEESASLSRARSWLFYVLIRLPILLSCWVLWKTHNPIPLFLYAFLTTLTILFYGADKKRALSSRWRIPEIYLHLLELMGGWPGALLAQRNFRHKLSKTSYQRVFWGIVVLHGLVWILFIAFDFSMSDMMRALSSGLGRLSDLFP